MDLWAMIETDLTWFEILQWFDSLGYVLPRVVDIASLWIMCIAILSSVHFDAIHFAFLSGPHLCPAGWSHWVHVWGKKKLRWKSTRRAELPLWETEIPSSRAQGSGFKIRLVMEKGTRPGRVKHSAMETFGVSGSIQGNTGSVVAFMSAVFVSRHMTAKAFLRCFCFYSFIFVYLVLNLPFRIRTRT